MGTFPTLRESDKIACAECGVRDWYLGDHIVEAHGMSVGEYQSAHPNAPVVAEVLWDHYVAGQATKRRKLPPTPDNLTVKFRSVPFGVHPNVPQSACLPLPAHYRVPEFGKLSKDVGHAAVALAKGRSMYVWGLPGSGKDAFFHAYSALSRTPGRIFAIRPGTDIEAWFFSRAFNEQGTYWEEGPLLKALRDGYTAPDGSIVPYLILITDFDRADRSQAEALRLILDSIQGRIQGPTATYPVLPGTVICVTANTSGGGDVRGRMISANPLDGSLMDRFNVKLQFHWMDWRDEELICRAKFPALVERCEEAFGQVGKCVKAIRADILQENIHWEFSHRAVENWLTHAEDLMEVRGKVDKNLLKRAARVVLDGAPDPETNAAVRKLMDPHLPGGALESSGVEDEND